MPCNCNIKTDELSTWMKNLAKIDKVFVIFKIRMLSWLANFWRASYEPERFSRTSAKLETFINLFGFFRFNRDLLFMALLFKLTLSIKYLPCCKQSQKVCLLFSISTFFSFHLFSLFPNWPVLLDIKMLSTSGQNKKYYFEGFKMLRLN